MKEIAARAGVSIATVSLALKSSPQIGPDNARRIRELADRMGYQMNPLVSALMQTRRSRSKPELHPSLALITDHPTRDGWQISATLRAFEGAARSRVEQCGYRLETFWRGEPGMTDQRLSQILHARGVRGVLLFPFANPLAELDLDWQHFATIALGFSIQVPYALAAGWRALCSWRFVAQWANATASVIGASPLPCSNT